MAGHVTLRGEPDVDGGPDKKSTRRWNVKDCGRGGDGAGMPRRDLRAVAVQREFCVIKSRLRARLTMCLVLPQQI